MNIIDVINKKRLGKELSYEELNYAFTGYLNKVHEDYQISSLLMAIVINGMTLKETINLTDIFIKSGKILDLKKINETILDKHSTGGIGDSTTLVVGPIVAASGLYMAKISGKGLGITGGTIDKLKSIPGFKTNLSDKEFKSVLKNVGFVNSEQTKNLVPLDKVIYNLRNNSGTTESIPLIASSIMSKKIASGADIILLDIKYGKGALLKNKTDAIKLGNWMKKIGENYNKKVITIFSDMNIPLSNAIGNRLEVREAINVLKGEKNRLYKVSKEIASKLISEGKNIPIDKAYKLVDKVISNGDALKKFKMFTLYQGGNIEKLKIIAKRKYIRSEKDGVLKSIDAEKVGKLALKLGAGKINNHERIDYNAGVLLKKDIGDTVKKDDLLAILYTNKKIDLSNEDINCFKIE